MEETDGRLESVGGFTAGWFASDLGMYRPSRGTYQLYAYDSLPPLEPAPFTGDFGWLGDLGEPDPGQEEPIAALERGLAELGLTLPRDFAAFQRSAEEVRLVLDEVSVTACWTDVSLPLPSPVEEGARLVRFLRDQQDCLLWYLYLRPGGEAFVICSYLDYAYEYEAREAGEETGVDLADRAQQLDSILWCAPSFEEFAYRFWAENRIWHALHGAGPAALGPTLRRYLAHYGDV
ncbi:hypothetical protein GCM10009665_70270 [Kitasatospora nipponensis]|uniref:SUKH-4 immunity protein of toxin-antitoxin system n=1 Tax=Kitasatospora nipponensis TaxID=258049 RepID=A0ABP4HPD0_9ACTN